MPDSNAGREKVLKFIKENNISVASLAAKYDVPRQDLSNYLNGRVVHPKGHNLILRIIEDHKIR